MVKSYTSPHGRIFYAGCPDVGGLLHYKRGHFNIMRPITKIACGTRAKNVMWVETEIRVTCPKCKKVLQEAKDAKARV